ncbi:MAG: ComEC/Rec2 family competence protein [Bacteriovoracia bacterium]
MEGPRSCGIEQFVRRWARPGCWVSYVTPDATVCVEPSAWRHALQSGLLWRECVRPLGTWKVNARGRTFRARSWKREPETSGEKTPSYSGNWLDRGREQVEVIRERLSQRIHPDDSLGIVAKLILDEGASAGLEWFRQLGFVHLLTASGIHLYALADLVYRNVRFITSGILRPEAALRVARVFSFLFWLGAWLLSGARWGLLRPALVVLIRASLKPWGLRFRVLSPLLLALAVSWGLEFAGRWTLGYALWGSLHYALAVGGGLLAREALGRRRSVFLQHAAMAVGSWLPTAFIGILECGSVALLTPVLSLVTISIGVGLLYPAIMLACGAWILGGDEAIVGVVASAVRLTSFVLAQLFDWGAKCANVWVVPAWALWVGLFGAGLLQMTSRARRLRTGLSVLLLLWAGRGVLFFWRELATRADTQVTALAVTQLDVGQGDSAWVETGNGQGGAIDVGSAWARSSIQWGHWLMKRGLDRIDFVALTHLDEDHAGGLKHLARFVPIGCVVTGIRQWETLRGRELRAWLTSLGIRTVDWSSGCFPFASFESEKRDRRSRGNSYMGAVAVPLAKGGAYLSGGDAGSEAEPEIAAWFQGLGLRRPWILKINHHGSRFSTESTYLKRLRPQQAWISCGRGNRYGHPHAEVIDRINRFKIPLHRTDQEGELIFTGNIETSRE